MAAPSSCGSSSCHITCKQKFPDEEAARGVPYDGVENLRPETKAAVEAFFHKRNSATQWR